MKIGKQFYFGALIAISVIFVTAIFYFYQNFYTQNFLIDKKVSGTYIFIKEGDDFKTLLKQLEDNKIIANKLSFAFVAQLRGYQKNVKAGKYYIKAGATT